MDIALAYRRCLEEVDVPGIMKLWAHTNPHLPQPQSQAEGLAAIHAARTAAESLPKRLRFYSHRWLLDHGFQSLLPDRLKPSAERMYPKPSISVGISINTRIPELKGAADYIQKSMSGAVEGAYADGIEDQSVIKKVMIEARDKARRQMFGRFTADAPIMARISGDDPRGNK